MCLKTLAIPTYMSSGIFKFNQSEYRFLIMPKFETDLKAILDSNRLSEKQILIIMKELLYALEYIHGQGFAHGDIKASNIMLDKENHLILLDFGLCNRFKRDMYHHKYEIIQESMHQGTLEFTSIDAHNGASETISLLKYEITQIIYKFTKLY